MRTPALRLDKLPALLTPEGSRSSVDVLESHTHTLTSTGSPLNGGAPSNEPHHSSSASARRDSRDRRSPPRSPQARHHSRSTVVPALSSLSTIFSGPTSNGPSKKSHSQNDRIKALLRDRAAARGIKKGDTAVEATGNASPEPSQLASLAIRGANNGTSVGAGPPLLSPEPSSLIDLDAKMLPVVREEDIQRAFRYFAGEHDWDSFTEEQLLDRTAPFYPGLSSKDARLLMGHGAMSADKLHKVLRLALHRDLGEFDAVAEAFKVLDPRGSGQADMDILADLLAHLPGVHKLTAEDRAFLLKISDIDGDGFISEADFRRCSTFLPPTPQDLAVAQDAATW